MKHSQNRLGSGWSQPARTRQAVNQAAAPWAGMVPKMRDRPYAIPRLRRADEASSAPPPGPWCRDEKLARLEAALFLASEPLNVRKLSQLASLADGTEARTLIRRLNQLYDAQGSAFRAEEVAGGYQLLTRRRFAGWLRRLLQTPVDTRLSAPALETLAVVAYRQPVVRAEVEAVRGVQCGELLRQLMDRDLIRIVGRSDDLGRPFLYGTTRRFLQVFGLRHLDELPRAEVLRARSPSGDVIDGPTEIQAGASQPPELPNSDDPKGDAAVKIAASLELSYEENVEQPRLARWANAPQAVADDDDEEDDDLLDDEDEDEDDDLDDEDEDFDDDWEEVDDEDEDEEDEEWDDEDEEDDDWDDDDDDDWDDEDEDEDDED